MPTPHTHSHADKERARERQTGEVEATERQGKLKSKTVAISITALTLWIYFIFKYKISHLKLYFLSFLTLVCLILVLLRPCSDRHEPCLIKCSPVIHLNRASGPAGVPMQWVSLKNTQGCQAKCLNQAQLVPQCNVIRQGTAPTSQMHANAVF